MPSPQYEKLVGILWDRRVEWGDHPVEPRRAAMDEVALPMADDVTADPVDVDGLAAEWVIAAGAGTKRTVLYLHGGGYVMGSLATHRKLAGDISRAADARVLLLDYRLAPEHPYPAAVDDAVHAYRWLLAAGTTAGAIAIAGDSAGGGLTISTLLALRDAGLPQPGAAVAISPWTDLTLEAASIESVAARDPIVRAGDLKRYRDWYLDGTDPRHPGASPAHADLTGLAPILVHVGEAEVLLDDAAVLADHARRDGVEVTLEAWPDMVHVWHVFAGRVPEATAAVERIGEFVRERLG
ncbi:MAG TPA: alpha/beta hydrolase [Acidimicrobiales bacterium]|nr:alpha/beta hydrolase [Acidimicrobiales bacterium]